MDNIYSKEENTMKCSSKGCPGDYENRNIVHTVSQDNKVTVIDHVPAEVCSICGDVLLAPTTIRHIENILESSKSPERTVPLYEYV